MRCSASCTQRQDPACDWCARNVLAQGRIYARSIGVGWAENVALRGFGAREWSEVDTSKADAIARRKVRHLAHGGARSMRW